MSDKVPRLFLAAIARYDRAKHCSACDGQGRCDACELALSRIKRGVHPDDAWAVCPVAVCEVCGAGDVRLVLDHDHALAHARVRGWICDRCNKVLGQVVDDPELLEQLAVDDPELLEQLAVYLRDRMQLGVLASPVMGG